MYASLSSNKYSKSYLFLATDGPDSQIWALIACTVVLQRKRYVKLLCYCKNENFCKCMCLKKYCIHCTCTCTCNTVWEASWTCPVTVMMITVIVWYTRIAPTVYVFRLENRSMIFTCVVGVDRQLSVSAMCVRYVCRALFKSVLNMLHFRASHWKLEDLRTTNLSQECQVNCNCLPACENQLPSCWKSHMKLLLMMRYSLFFHLKHNNTWINKVSVWMSPWGEIPVQVKRPSLFFLFSV